MPENTVAFILAAGLGTRLKQFTQYQPKALVPLIDKPLLQHAIEHIAQFGIKKIVINVHHFAQQIKDFIQVYQTLRPDLALYISDESDQLLDTGGAIKKARDFFGKGSMAKVLVFNADILSNIALDKMIIHFENQNIDALLAVRHRNSSRYLHFDVANQLSAWSNPTKNLVKYVRAGNIENWQTAAFSGIHLFKTSLLEYLPSERVFSIIDWYLHLAQQNFNLNAYWHDEDYWFDMGKPESLLAARNYYLHIR